MNPYTIVLAYPDYVATNGPEFWIGHADGDGPAPAIEAAQRQACRASSAARPDDFLPVACFSGRHEDILGTLP